MRVGGGLAVTLQVKYTSPPSLMLDGSRPRPMVRLTMGGSAWDGGRVGRMHQLRLCTVSIFPLSSDNYCNMSTEKVTCN